MTMKNKLFKPGIVLLSLCCLAVVTAAQSKKARASDPSVDAATVKQLAYADSSRLINIFIDLHQHPELAFMENRTASIIAKELQALGYEVISGIAKTGVAGILRNGNGPVVMYRADMDGLPVKEATGLPYASTVVAKRDDGTEVPVMHACGHDAHISWLLGIARIMMTLKSQWKGTLVLVAQPAEEVGLGAEGMVKDKMYERGVPVPDYLFGMHTFPFPTGYVSNIAGVRMAGIDVFDVTFYGVGGHGSAPHLAKDPVTMAAMAVVDYHSVVDRAIPPQNPHVITVGSITAGTANNIIPASATLKMSLRWFNQSDRTLMIDGINRVNRSIAMAHDLPQNLYPTVLTKGMSYPVKNDTFMVNKINGAFEKMLAPGKNLTDRPAVMISEDFPFLVINSRKDPVYDYMLVGIADPAAAEKAAKEGKEFPFYNHNPGFAVDLSAIPFGTMTGATAILELFRK